MRTTLQIEWMKVRNYRTFWILLAITIVSIPGFNYMFYDIFDNKFPKMRGKSIFGSPFAFPDVWQTVSWNAGGVLFLIPAILIITLTTNEFTYRTHRQNVIDGWSRGQFVGVKMLEILLLSIFTTLIVGLTALAFGRLGNKVPADVSIWQGSHFVAAYFVQMLAYSLIAFMMAMFIRRAGLAMGVFFVYLIIENIVVAVCRNRYHAVWVDYLPEEVTDLLIPQPYAKAIITQQGASRWESHVPVYLAVAAAYLLIFCIVSSRRFLKSDL
ncbi:MAG: ABC transporter permease [Bacteroidota bacterium]|nr:ABC transporter permease [Bacteroidota bacterium]MDP4216062.1 ABC transporter permease [Bacteroidota bacterium]MDP4246126.1 ABC transporter permease [Bacteroidota bacterium]MDP4256633.1 ABC transporter permease [Bacteroidota bacterium]